jgi:hypothetical protein
MYRRVKSEKESGWKRYYKKFLRDPMKVRIKMAEKIALRMLSYWLGEGERWRKLRVNEVKNKYPFSCQICDNHTKKKMGNEKMKLQRKQWRVKLMFVPRRLVIFLHFFSLFFSQGESSDGILPWEFFIFGVNIWEEVKWKLFQCCNVHVCHFYIFLFPRKAKKSEEFYFDAS